jgi:RHS repeat-associated protein
MGSVMEDQQDASGLLYRRNRYYNPASGRFTQEDPIGLAGGVNLYGFANGDPVSYDDPYGLEAEEVGGPCRGRLSCIAQMGKAIGTAFQAWRRTRAVASATRSGRLVIQQGGRFSGSEVRAAEEMAIKGHRVLLRSPQGTRAGGGTSDLVVDGANWDVYTPTTANAGRIISAVAKKNSQATGVVLDLSQTSVTPAQLGNVLARVRGAGATNIQHIEILP